MGDESYTASFAAAGAAPRSKSSCFDCCRRREGPAPPAAALGRRVRYRSARSRGKGSSRRLDAGAAPRARRRRRASTNRRRLRCGSGGAAPASRLGTAAADAASSQPPKCSTTRRASRRRGSATSTRRGRTIDAFTSVDLAEAMTVGGARTRGAAVSSGRQLEGGGDDLRPRRCGRNAVPRAMRSSATTLRRQRRLGYEERRTFGRVRHVSRVRRRRRRARAHVDRHAASGTSVRGAPSPGIRAAAEIPWAPRRDKCKYDDAFCRAGCLATCWIRLRPARQPLRLGPVHYPVCRRPTMQPGGARDPPTYTRPPSAASSSIAAEGGGRRPDDGGGDARCRSPERASTT